MLTTSSLNIGTESGQAQTLPFILCKNPLKTSANSTRPPLLDRTLSSKIACSKFCHARQGRLKNCHSGNPKHKTDCFPDNVIQVMAYSMTVALVHSTLGKLYTFTSYFGIRFFENNGRICNFCDLIPINVNYSNYYHFIDPWKIDGLHSYYD